MHAAHSFVEVTVVGDALRFESLRPHVSAASSGREIMLTEAASRRRASF